MYATLRVNTNFNKMVTKSLMETLCEKEKKTGFLLFFRNSFYNLTEKSYHSRHIQFAIFKSFQFGQKSNLSSDKDLHNKKTQLPTEIIKDKRDWGGGGCSGERTMIINI